MTNLDCVLRRNISLPTKVRIVKTMVFPVVMYRHESWTIKKAKHQRTDAFELWCWRKLWRVPWTAWRSNQTIVKEISSLSIHCKDWCWSWSSNTLTAWCKQLTHWKRLWCWARLRAGEGGDRGWVVRWHHWLSGHEFEQTPRDSKGQGSLAFYSSRGHKKLETT